MHGYKGIPPLDLSTREPKTNTSREEQIEQASKTREEIPQLDKKNMEKCTKNTSGERLKNSNKMT